MILADDMRYDEAQHLPNLAQHLTEPGVTFTSARHNIALCSPARAGFVTGQYSIRHRVRSQSDAFGQLNDDHRTLPMWMTDAGYDTGIVGKYFTGGNRSAPGWRFRRQLAASPQEQYGYTVWDGERETSPGVDQTSYLAEEVTRFLRTAPEPFFLWFTPTADHWPLQPPPGHEADASALQWPDAREEDVGDKPPWIQALPALTDNDLRLARSFAQSRIRELLGLDDTIGSMFGALEQRGILGNTLVAFSSDNGVELGEHRLPLLAKNFPYEPCVRVPCVLRAPNLEPGTVTQPTQMSVDLTATCVEVARASPDLALDGVSLLKIAAAPHLYDDRRLLYDRDDRDNSSVACPQATGVFTSNRKLIRYDASPRTYELYDLDQDPGELRNVADDPAYAEDRSVLEADLESMLNG